MNSTFKHRAKVSYVHASPHCYPLDLKTPDQNLATSSTCIKKLEKTTFSIPNRVQLLLILFLGLMPLSIMGQDATKEAHLEIKEVTLNYITNFFLNDFESMSKSFHSKMTKRGINKDLNYQELTLEELKGMLQRKKALDITKQKHEVSIMGLTGNAASVFLKTGYPSLMWYEHILLAKEDNSWKIIDILWDYEKFE